ncbi:MAG: DUF1189 family protein [Elusimicrobiaceae bacterium]|nr:DUF1189 family protein [Elusimicrobiaceae bacterium]
MADFLLSPFKAIYNLNTYIKATKQSFWKTLLFLVYLLVAFSILFFAVILIKTPPLTPFFKEITEQVAQVMPDIEIKDGKLTANNGQLYEFTPEGLDQKIVFDTSRTEPVYPTQIVQEGIGILITDTTIYMVRDGQVQSYDMNLDKNTNITLNGQYILDNEEEIINYIKRVLFLAAVLLIPFMVLFLMGFLIILAIIATAISQLFVKAEVSFGDVCSICCYLLAPAFLFFFLVIILPFNIPFVWPICFVLFMVYSQFILNKIKAEQSKTNEE